MANQYSVTITLADATTADIAASVLTITVTANDGTNDGTASETVALAARTVPAPLSTVPVVAITPIAGTKDADFDVVFTATDDAATLTAANITVAGSSDPDVDASYTIGAVTADATVANQYSVTITLADATTADIVASTLTITVTANNGTNDGTASETVALAARAMTPTIANAY